MQSSPCQGMHSLLKRLTGTFLPCALQFCSVSWPEQFAEQEFDVAVCHFRCWKCLFDLCVVLCNAGVSEELFHSVCCLAKLCELGNYISYYFDQREKETR